LEAKPWYPKQDHLKFQGKVEAILAASKDESPDSSRVKESTFTATLTSDNTFTAEGSAYFTTRFHLNKSFIPGSAATAHIFNDIVLASMRASGLDYPFYSIIAHVGSSTKSNPFQDTTLP
jgi:hypothetical protein